MAGSLKMMIHDVKEIEGDFTNPHALIENMGDAYEACEEAVAEIERLRAELERITKEEAPEDDPGRRRDIDIGWPLRATVEHLRGIAREALRHE